MRLVNVRHFIRETTFVTSCLHPCWPNPFNGDFASIRCQIFVCTYACDIMQIIMYAVFKSALLITCSYISCNEAPHISIHIPQLVFYINLLRVVIGPSATLTGRQRPTIDLCRMLTGTVLYIYDIRAVWPGPFTAR